MKKLIISIVATASIALVAKADVAPNATSFENYEGDFSVGKTDAGEDSGDKYWAEFPDGAQPELKLIDIAADSKPTRPKYWIDRTPDAKALSIDTDVALSRNVAASGAAQTIGDGLYFDSMVQFTATDTAPTPTPTSEGVIGDKLIVWLKEVAAGNETRATYALYVTAGVKVQGQIIATPFRVTNVDVAPDTWHRLTIAINRLDEATPTFKVYVDGNAVRYLNEADENAVEKSCEASPFGSLAEAGANSWDKITSVSFEGKGAIDDLVWTNDDPYAATVDVKWTGYQSEDIMAAWGLPNDEDSVSEEFPIVATVGQTIRVACLLPKGYSVKCGETAFTSGEVFGGREWYYDVEITSGLTSLTFTIVQDATPVAQIGNTEYITLNAAIAAATEGANEITLLKDIATDAAFVIEKTVVINLNGKTVNTTENDKSGDGVFCVKTGGVLTINDTAGGGKVNGVGGNPYNMAIWADGGIVVINGGNYTNEGAKDPADSTHFDLIYAKNEGKVFINGGTFRCETPNWTLNSNNVHNKPGSFVVTGGSFYDYDPSAPKTDDPVISWCADGYEAKQNAGGYYVVTKKTTTVKPGAPVEVDSVAAANAVEIEVVVPAGVQITAEAYKAYFKKSIVPNKETGKYEVSAVLKDEVAPVIEATTDDDGVTPAISFDANGNVTINISNKLPGLFYGVKYATTVGGVEAAEPIPGLTVETNGGTAGFFRVVVDFEPIPDAADAE